MNIKQPDDIADQIPDEILATSITKLSDGIAKFRSGPLREETVVLLLHHSTRVPLRDIRKVISGIASLKKDYCKPVVKA